MPFTLDSVRVAPGHEHNTVYAMQALLMMFLSFGFLLLFIEKITLLWIILTATVMTIYSASEVLRVVPNCAQDIQCSYKVWNDNISPGTSSSPFPFCLVANHMSRREALWYTYHVNLNVYINIASRFVRFLCVWNVNPKDPTKSAYYLFLNTVLHTWIEPSGNATFENVKFPRRNSSYMCHRVVLELDHNIESITRIVLESNESKSSTVIENSIVDPIEILFIVQYLLSSYAHPAVHRIAGLIHQCEPQWELAKIASIAVTGLNYSALSTSFLFFPDMGQTVVANSTARIPHHFLNNTEVRALLESKSNLFRCICAAHRNPHIIRAAKGDPVRLAAIIHGSMTHSLDHYVIDAVVPLVCYSKYFEVNFTLVRNLIVSSNYDFLFQCRTPVDDVTTALAQIVEKNWPEVRIGWKWAVIE
jgi:hypothetical protein